MNVLLLDIKHDLEPSIVEMLERAGHIVEFPNSREEALVFINQRAFDCVVLSYALSNEMIEEFIELLRQTSPTSSIIAISENGEMDLKFQPAIMLQWRQGAEALISTLSQMDRRVPPGEQLRDRRLESVSKGRQRRYSDKPAET